MRTHRVKTRNAVDDIDGEIKPINLVDNGEFQRSIDVAFLLIAAHVNVVMIPAAITELVDQRRIGMEIKNYGLVGSEKRIKVAVGKSMRMLSLRHEPE